MVQGCSMKLAKGLLFLFNFIFFLAGLTIVVIASMALASLDKAEFLSGSLPGATIFILVVGAIILTISFFGCCGAFTENYCMVVTFCLVMVIIFIMEVGGVIGVYVAGDDISGLIADGMQESMNKYDQEGQDEATTAWSVMQAELKCCGTLGPQDWNQTTYGEIPDSCYADDGDIYDNGCLEVLILWCQSNMLSVAGAFIGLVVIQMFGVGISCALAREVKRKDYDKV